MLRAPMKKRSSIARFHADTVRLGISFIAWLPVQFVVCSSVGSEKSAASATAPLGSHVAVVVNEYCVNCHNGEVKKGGLGLDNIVHEDPAQHADAWERVVRKLRARQMPPIGKDRPEERTYEEIVSRLAASLDRAAAKHPNPGRTE